MNTARFASYPPDGTNAREPSIARVYDYLLGGKDNYDADRKFAAKLTQVLSDAPTMARENRRFLVRTVRYLAGEAGIRQFIDIGTGLPTQQNVHEIAQATDPDAKTVYVDYDPVVVTHARALLNANGRTAFVQADMRIPQDIIGSAEVETLIDLSAPIAVLFVSVLHFIPDDEPERIITAFREVMAPGSFLVISHAEDQPALEAATELYREKMGAGAPRTREQIDRLFGGFELVDPGLVRLPQWRPDAEPHPRLKTPPSTDLPFLGGVGKLGAGGGDR